MSEQAGDVQGTISLLLQPLPDHDHDHDHDDADEESEDDDDDDEKSEVDDDTLRPGAWQQTARIPGQELLTEPSPPPSWGSSRG